MGHLTHYRCPVTDCPGTKNPEQVACGTHWLQVPRELRDRVERLQRSTTETELRRNLIVGVVAALNAPPGPTKRWAALMRDEHGRLADEARARAAGEWEPVTCRQILAETRKAVQVALVDEREVWIPKSLLGPVEDLADGRRRLLVPKWFARREGIRG